MRELSAALLSIVLYGMAAPAIGQWPHEIIDAMDDQRLILFLKDEDIAASPDWHPAENSRPPMTIAEALDLLKQWMVGDSRYSDAEIHEIELKPIREHEQEHRWYYLVQLRNGGKRNAPSRYAAVLLNGKVVPVIAEPESIK